MVLRGGRQAEFGEDAGDVLLDRPLRDHKLLGYGSVAATFCHEFEHLVLPGSQHGEWIVYSPAPQHLRDDLWIERRAPLCDSTYRICEAFKVVDAVFDEVANSSGVITEQLHGVGSSMY
jgi:hypothetical protein